MDGKDVLAVHKTSTTPDIGAGIRSALDSVMREGQCEPAAVEAVMIGTTHFVNAVVERRRLLPAAALRLALPATTGLPPFAGWPPDLRAALGNHVYLAHGGCNFDGSEISAIDEAEIRTIGADLEAKRIRSIAVTSPFSVLDHRMEQEAARILHEVVPDLAITLSCQIGRIGILERENAAIINACLRDESTRVISSFEQALRDAGIDAPLYISQNDGTLMNREWAQQYPVLTFSSGPTNSMRGAALLSGESDAIVVDIGGTTADIGALQGGFPRPASAEVEIAGVKTNFRMPDVFSIGLGGGSLVHRDGDSVDLGPESVGYELTARALVFGGDTLTATDIAVAAGQVDIGDRSAVAHLPVTLVEAATDRIHRLIELGIDRMKTQDFDVPVILVGGGSILVGRPLEGTSHVRTPANAAVANAIGAAIGQIGGEIDEIVSFDGRPRDEVLAQVCRQAGEKAIAAGADPATVEIVDVEEVPLTYMADAGVARFRVKAVGDLVYDRPRPEPTAARRPARARQEQDAL